MKTTRALHVTWHHQTNLRSVNVSAFSAGCGSCGWPFTHSGMRSRVDRSKWSCLSWCPLCVARCLPLVPDERDKYVSISSVSVAESKSLEHAVCQSHGAGSPGESLDEDYRSRGGVFGFTRRRATTDRRALDIVEAVSVAPTRARATTERRVCCGHYSVSNFVKRALRL